MKLYPEFYEFDMDVMTVPFVISISLWLLFYKQTSIFEESAKGGLALSIGWLLIFLPLIRPGFSDQSAEDTVRAMIWSGSGSAIAVVLGLTANRYTEDRFKSGWILIVVGFGVLGLELFGMLELLHWWRPI
jgi:hypothetical protein